MPRRLPPIYPKLTSERYAALAAESRAGSNAAAEALAAAIAAGVEKAIADFLLGRDGGDDVAEEGPAAAAADAAGEGEGRQEAVPLARLEAIEAEHRVAWQQIHDERADVVLIAQMKEDAVRVAQNRAILDSVAAARAADGVEGGEDGDEASGEDGDDEWGAYSDEDEPAAADGGEAADGAAVQQDAEWWGDSDEMPDADGGEAAGGDADEETPDIGNGDGWGSSIEFEMTNAGVILISSGEE